ncbi:hypothetical protein HMPREF0216_03063 [Clostridium celatum DSM 1785]|uniref:Uncharacterized protein n=1 Tax=Clostridium celatum DSM 1785 TaxID=545697 RepID=L1Q5M1_9CLOT|nr:hypothetical protein HMPREF0216_03063 [Clostridium celatum DSM 1785]
MMESTINLNKFFKLKNIFKFTLKSYIKCGTCLSVVNLKNIIKIQSLNTIYE